MYVASASDTSCQKKKQYCQKKTKKKVQSHSQRHELSDGTQQRHKSVIKVQKKIKIKIKMSVQKNKDQYE